MRKASICITGLFVALVAAQNSVRAGVMTPLAPSDLNTIQFQAWENEYDSTGHLLAANTALGLNDRLRGVLRVNNVTSNSFNNNPESTGHQLTAVFDLKVVAVDIVGVGPNTSTVLTFGPDGAFSNSAIQPGGTVSSSSTTGGLDFSTLGLSGNTMIAFYDSTGSDFTKPVTATTGAFFSPTLTPTTAQAEQLATQGTLLGAFGYGTGSTAPTDIGAAGNGYWYSVGNIGGTFTFSYGLSLLTPPAGGTNGLFNVFTMTPILNNEFSTTGLGAVVPPGSQVTDNYPSPTGSGTTFFDITGIGHVTGNTSSQFGRTDLYRIAANDPGQVFPNPEPSTLVLVGIGAMGLGFVRRRRKALN